MIWLPQELWIIVFSFLSAPALAAAAKTCKQWKLLCDTRRPVDLLLIKNGMVDYHEETVWPRVCHAFLINDGIAWTNGASVCWRSKDSSMNTVMLGYDGREPKRLYPHCGDTTYFSHNNTLYGICGDRLVTTSCTGFSLFQFTGGHCVYVKDRDLCSSTVEHGPVDMRYDVADAHVVYKLVTIPRYPGLFCTLSSPGYRKRYTSANSHTASVYRTGYFFARFEHKCASDLFWLLQPFRDGLVVAQNDALEMLDLATGLKMMTFASVYYVSGNLVSDATSDTLTIGCRSSIRQYDYRQEHVIRHYTCTYVDGVYSLGDYYLLAHCGASVRLYDTRASCHRSIPAFEFVDSEPTFCMKRDNKMLVAHEGQINVFEF